MTRETTVSLIMGGVFSHENFDRHRHNVFANGKNSVRTHSYAYSQQSIKLHFFTHKRNSTFSRDAHCRKAHFGG